MMFMQGQAQDNRSNDLYLLDGVVKSAEDPRVIAEIAVASKVRLQGNISECGQTLIAALNGTLAVEIHTEDFDANGRPAPLIASFPITEVELDNIPDLVAILSAQAAAIERRFDSNALSDDLTTWRLRPKESGGLLLRLYRRLRNWFMSIFRGWAQS